MIRPFTLLCMLLAAGSGLYLYQAKQQGRMLDRQIREVRAQAAATHQRAEVLRTEYTLLNDPSRLSELVEAHLPDLKPTRPAQWSAMAELDKRLPPVGEPTQPASPLEPPRPDDTAPEVAPMASPMAAAGAPPIVALAEPAPSPAPFPRPAATVAPRPAPPPRAALALVREPQLAPAARSVPARPPLAVAWAPTRGAARPATQISATPILATLRRAPEPTAAPATAAEAVARIAHGGPVDPSVPAVASALGMARTMLVPAAVTPANAATTYASQAGTPR